MRLSLLALLLAAAAAAQTPLVVTGTAPADFASGVPLAATLAFTVSAPLAPGALPPLVAFPDSLAEVAPAVLSADGLTLSYAVALRANTRYVFLLPAALGADGQRLARPAALNLTTAASPGALTVRGTVTDPSGAALDGTLVALATADLSSGAVSLVAVRVLDAASASQAYALGPVAFGLYTAAALRLPGVVLGTGTAEPGLGFYDANGDGTPDPILNPNGVGIALAPLPTATALDGLAAAAAAADAALPGAVLDAVPPRTVDAGGGASFWLYGYSAPDGAAAVSVAVVGPLAVPVPTPLAQPLVTPLPAPGVDTDAALAAAEGAGGAAFRDANAAREVAVTVGTEEPPLAPVPVWRVRYEAREGGAVTGSFQADVDLVTGAVVSATAAATAPGAARLGLRLAGPNPARGTVRLAVEAPRGAARVVVLDALGRVVAVLHDGPLAGDVAALAWTPDVPPGVYRVRLETAGGTASTPVTVLR